MMTTESLQQYVVTTLLLLLLRQQKRQLSTPGPITMLQCYKPIHRPAGNSSVANNDNFLTWQYWE